MEGEKIRLRPLEPADLQRWRMWINDPEIAGYLDRVLPVSAPEHEQFFERAVTGNTSAVWYAIELKASGQFVGNVWLWNISTRHRHAELRILIGERSAWGSGCGAEAISLLTGYGFKQLGLHKVYAFVMARNSRAVRTFEKCEFDSEALLVEDVFWNGQFENVHRVFRLNKDA